MAFANLFASPPGEADFNVNDLTPACRRSDRTYQDMKRPYQTPRNTNPKKRKRTNDVSSDEARKWPNPQKERQDHRIPFKEEQVDVHQKLSLSQDKETPQRPSCKGHPKEGQRSQKINKRDHYAKNRMHRANINEDANNQWGRETNSGRGGVFDDKKGAKMLKRRHKNTFNQRGEAGSKKGRNKGRMERQRPMPGERKPFMTQEFKEQNSINVNGRLICKHFLGDRCLKGDQCQFEHSHDLGGFKFNEVCKFYVQGFCLKGQRCLFMHRTFPCKFFHTGRKCHQDVNCKFSHDALTELTKGLLDKLLEEQKVAREALQCETQDPEPEPEPVPVPLDFLNNPIKLSFYSAALVPENLATDQLSVGGKDAELIPESPVSTSQAAPSSIAHTPLTAATLPPTASLAQSSPVTLNLFNSAPPPMCRFSFGAKDADFTPPPPSSARQPHLSPAQTDPLPDPHTPLTASPASPSAVQPYRLAAVVSPVPPGAEDSLSDKTKGPRSPTPPSATSSGLRTLFTHLSPCRPDNEEEEDSCTDTDPLINETKLCTKDMAMVKEKSENHTKVPEPVLDLKAEPEEHVLALKTESHFVKNMKKWKQETEKPLKPVPCASTPVMNPRRTYRPLSVDLSPLPPLPFTAYRPHLSPTASLQAVSSEASNTSVNSKSQSAVRCHVPFQPQVGVCKTQVEKQGRHSLPVQTLTWSVPSTRSAPQPVSGKRSLNGELDPC